MGSVFNRGNRVEPNWYVKFREIDGAWRMKPSGKATKEQAKTYLRQVESRVADERVGVEQKIESPRFSAVAETWISSLTNRSAYDDRLRLRKHLAPVFGPMFLRDITLRSVMHWIDDQKARGEIAEPTIRHNLNLLSRFFSWAVERGHAQVNPVRLIPMGKRPRQSPRRDVPWLDDEAIVRRLVNDLGEPVGLMFYLGNRSGLRTGEILGLRMSDLGFLAEGVIRARFSYDGPLKEDKAGSGKVKWVPAAEDASALIEPWLARRGAEGAGPEDLLFPCARRGGGTYRKEYVEGIWEKAAGALDLSLTWYEATRHSFVSRSLARGASLDEVSAAVGHSSPVVTRRFYDHFVRKSFSATLRAGLGITRTASAGAGAIVPFERKPPVRSNRPLGADLVQNPPLPSTASGKP